MPAVPENAPRDNDIKYYKNGIHVEPDVPPEVVIAERRGQILLKQTILKSDYFPGTACCLFKLATSVVGLRKGCTPTVELIP